jgi:protein-S-isoprenylcysteine O-methyltransferase Ste14
MTLRSHVRTLVIHAMSALRSSIFAVWAVFWIYWLIAATNVKEHSRQRSPMRRIRPVSLIIIVAAIVVIHNVRGAGSLTIHSPVIEAVGTIVFLSGLALAVWARVHLGRNWGMPMSRKDDPELVTSGPYRFIRHPIYSGILLAVLGTALAVNLDWLLLLGLLGAWFVHSATVEEGLMTDQFPSVYPAYRNRTRMLGPFLL